MESTTQATANTFLTPEVLIAVLIGFIVGAVIVWLLGRKGSDPADNPLQKPYDDLQAEYKSYRQQVNSHFSKTASAVDNLTKSYQEVFDHLSAGAQQLMEGEALKLERDKRQGKAVTLAYLSDIDARQSGIPTAAAAAAKEPAALKPDSKNDARIAPRPAEAAKPAAQPKSDKTAPNPAPAAPGKAGADKSEVELVEKPLAAGAGTAAVQVAEKPLAEPNEAVQAAVEAEVKDNKTVAATAKEPGMPIEKPAAHISEAETAAAKKEGTEENTPADKTAAQKAAENAGLTPVNSGKSADPLAEVKRHLRDNQEKK